MSDRRETFDTDDEARAIRMLAADFVAESESLSGSPTTSAEVLDSAKATNRDMLRDDPRVMEAIRCDPRAHVAWIPALCDEIESLRADADRLEAAVGGLVRDKTRLESANAKLREELADVTQRLMEKTGWA